MTLTEFKAWFDGYTENLDGPPNAKEWERIHARIKEIDVQKIYPGRYIPDSNPVYDWPYIVTCHDATGISYEIVDRRPIQQ